MNRVNEVILKLKESPVSFQSSSQKAKIFKRKIIEEANKYNFVYTDELSIEITWYTLEHLKLFGPNISDIDNIVKPTLDAIVSSGKLIVDDSQISYVSCSFIDSFEEYIEIRIIPRVYDVEFDVNNLEFIEFTNGFVYPINSALFVKELWETYYFPSLKKYVELAKHATNLLNLKSTKSELDFNKILSSKLELYGINTLEELYDLIYKLKLNLPMVGKIYPKNKINNSHFKIISLVDFLKKAN